MKYLSLFLLAVLLVAIAASAENQPIDYPTSFTAEHSGNIGPFREIAIVNTGGADMFIRFKYGSASATLSTDSIRIPAGSSMYDDDIGRTAYAFFISSAGTTCTGWYD